MKSLTESCLSIFSDPAPAHSFLPSHFPRLIIGSRQKSRRNLMAFLISPMPPIHWIEYTELGPYLILNDSAWFPGHPFKKLVTLLKQMNICILELLSTTYSSTWIGSRIPTEIPKRNATPVLFSLMYHILWLYKSIVAPKSGVPTESSILADRLSNCIQFCPIFWSSLLLCLFFLQAHLS